jgi:hypothetical protein
LAQPIQGLISRRSEGSSPSLGLAATILSLRFAIAMIQKRSFDKHTLKSNYKLLLPFAHFNIYINVTYHITLHAPTLSVLFREEARVLFRIMCGLEDGKAEDGQEKP